VSSVASNRASVLSGAPMAQAHRGVARTELQSDLTTHEAPSNNASYGRRA
jgi:hypothetical protein